MRDREDRRRLSGTRRATGHSPQRHSVGVHRPVSTTILERIRLWRAFARSLLGGRWECAHGLVP